ncbi:MAG: YggT family protein [Rhodospirillaceae bacterium]|nr:MAG: YggT family protein [Rhodospirillaceae bacterium]
MQTLLIPLLQVVDVVLNLYSWAVIISVVLSWLVNFNVVNPSNQFVRMVGSSLHQLVEPALNRIRRVLPMFGALDLSPIVLLLIIFFLQRVIAMIELQFMR